MLPAETLSTWTSVKSCAAPVSARSRKERMGFTLPIRVADGGLFEKTNPRSRLWLWDTYDPLNPEIARGYSKRTDDREEVIETRTKEARRRAVTYAVPPDRRVVFTNPAATAVGSGIGSPSSRIPRR